MTAIGQLRMERGLTQKQLAAAVGKAKSTVRGWEQGAYRPSDRDFPKIAEALGCNVEQIWIPAKRKPSHVQSAKEKAVEAENREKATPYIERRVAFEQSD